MHATFEAIKTELTQASELLKAIPSNEPLSIAHGNWSFAGVTRDELMLVPLNLIARIDSRGSESEAPNDALLRDYLRRLAFLRTNTIPQIWGGNSALAVAAFRITLEGLNDALTDATAGDDVSTSEHAVAAAKRLKELLGTLRAIETRLTSLGTRSQTVDAKIEAIERAHDAAEQLPTDLETLTESRATIGRLLMG